MIVEYTKLNLYFVVLEIVTSTCSSLRCHVCIGSNHAPCHSDAKSTQVLNCDEPDSRSVAAGWYKYMYEDEKPVNNTCIALTYYEGRYPVSLRACFPNYNETCEVFQETMISQDIEFHSCRVCEIDYCNRGHLHRHIIVDMIILKLSYYFISKYILKQD